MSTQNSLNNETYNADFLVKRQASSAGTTVFTGAFHLDTTNPASSAQVIAQTDSASGADAYHVAALASTRSYCWGIDASDSGSLKETTFAGGSTSPSSGTLTRRVTATGQQTMVLQPAFYAFLSAPTTADKTGDGTAYEVIFDTLTFSQNQSLAARGYDAATGRFHIDETGVYSFHCGISFGPAGIAHNLAQMQIFDNANATTIAQFTMNPSSTAYPVNGFNEWCCSGIFKCTAPTYVSVFITVSNGAKVVGLGIGTTYFSGALIC